MKPTIPSRNHLLFSVLLVVLPCMSVSAVEEEEAEVSKSSSVQHVGGLLFDVDEGVKIEKGGGGSVYVKSNREEMQQKFRGIEKRFDSIENRLTEIEKSLPKKDKPAAPASESSKEAARRVLAT